MIAAEDLPIDEMVDELRWVLEEFQNTPSHETMNKVFKECQRIERTVEDSFIGEDDDED